MKRRIQMGTLFKPKEKNTSQIVMLSTAELVPNKAQPRREFSEEALLSLAKSIKENGILQPICVRKNGAVYEIISGERRSRAAKLAGLYEVPCIGGSSSSAWKSAVYSCEQTAFTALFRRGAPYAAYGKSLRTTGTRDYQNRRTADAP